MSTAVIWPGSGSAASGSTPFGFYDADADFQSEAPKFAVWAARRMGYPIIDIELQDVNFYASFEEAISEYSTQVNQFNIKDNLLNLRGQSTTSNLTHKRVTPTLGGLFLITDQYGTEVGVGGNVDWKRGQISVTNATQSYDLDALYSEVSESGAAIEIRRVFHQGTPAVTRYFDPYAQTGMGTQNMLQQFGWGGMTPAVTFMMMPMYADLLRIQAIELNDQIRKSAYSFELINNKLKIFPIPTSDYIMYFDYIIKSERDNALQYDLGEATGSSEIISDFSNVPYDNMVYSDINDPGKQWIRKYALATAKEMLGMVRSKYQTLPIPNSETSLDGETLRTEATAEKETLVTQLREMLEQMSRKALLEASSEEDDNVQKKLRNIPLPIYIGSFILALINIFPTNTLIG